MLIGVVGFYFIIGGITSIISHSLKKKAMFSIYIDNLLKIKKKYKISNNLYNVALGSIFRKDYKSKRENFDDFFSKFPKKLRTKLKYNMYKNMLKNFEFTKIISPKNLIMIGEKMRRIYIRKSKPDKTSLFTEKSRCRIRSIL